MKRSRPLLIAFVAVLVLTSGLFIYKDASSLKGMFPSSPLLCPGRSLNTIYAKEGATSGGVGTKLRPYASLAEVQTALETDATIERVCVSGTLDGSLSLNSALTNSLTLTSYAPNSALSASGVVLQLEDSSAIEDFTLSYLTVTGTVNLEPDNSLTINHVTVDGYDRAFALGIGSADAVTISDSEIVNGDVGLQLSPYTDESVDSVDLTRVVFEGSYDALDLSATPNFSASESYFSYSQQGIITADAVTFSVEKSQFFGGRIAIDLSGGGASQTLLFANNFVANNSVFALVGRNPSLTATLVNNSFYHNATATALSGNITYMNNAAYSDSGDAAFSGTTPEATLVSDYNLFYGKVAWNVSTLSTWQRNSGQDLNSVYGDPLFTSDLDLHLQAGSPAIDIGTTLGTVSDDIDGDARTPGNYDVGADEY